MLDFEHPHPFDPGLSTVTWKRWVGICVLASQNYLHQWPVSLSPRFSPFGSVSRRTGKGSGESPCALATSWCMPSVVWVVLRLHITDVFGALVTGC